MGLSPTAPSVSLASSSTHSLQLVSDRATTGTLLIQFPGLAFRVTQPALPAQGLALRVVPPAVLTSSVLEQTNALPATRAAMSAQEQETRCAPRVQSHPSQSKEQAFALQSALTTPPTSSKRALPVSPVMHFVERALVLVIQPAPAVLLEATSWKALLPVRLSALTSLPTTSLMAPSAESATPSALAVQDPASTIATRVLLA